MLQNKKRTMEKPKTKAEDDTRQNKAVVLCLRHQNLLPIFLTTGTTRNPYFYSTNEQKNQNKT